MHELHIKQCVDPYINAFVYSKNAYISYNQMYKMVIHPLKLFIMGGTSLLPHNKVASPLLSGYYTCTKSLKNTILYCSQLSKLLLIVENFRGQPCILIRDKHSFGVSIFEIGTNHQCKHFFFYPFYQNMCEFGPYKSLIT